MLRFERIEESCFFTFRRNMGMFVCLFMLSFSQSELIHATTSSTAMITENEKFLSTCYSRFSVSIETTNQHDRFVDKNHGKAFLEILNFKSNDKKTKTDCCLQMSPVMLLRKIQSRRSFELISQKKMIIRNATVSWIQIA